MVEVIKVLDYTDLPTHRKELLFAKVLHCNETDKEEIFRIAKIYDLKITDYAKNSILLECVQSEDQNDELIKLLNQYYCNRIEIVRGGSVAIEKLKK